MTMTIAVTEKGETMRLIDADALLAEIEKNEGASDMPEQWHRGVWFVKWHIKAAMAFMPYNLDNHESDDADDKINALERTIAELRKINAELAEAHAAEADALAAQSIDELKTRIWVQSGIIDGLEKALRVALDVIKGGDGYATY